MYIYKIYINTFKIRFSSNTTCYQRVEFQLLQLRALKLKVHHVHLLGKRELKSNYVSQQTRRDETICAIKYMIILEVI